MPAQGVQRAQVRAAPDHELLGEVEIGPGEKDAGAQRRRVLQPVDDDVEVAALERGHEVGPVVLDEAFAHAEPRRESVGKAEREIPSDENALPLYDGGAKDLAQHPRRLVARGRVLESAAARRDPDAVPALPRDGRRAPVDGDRLVEDQNPGTSLAMISFMISLVPPPMVRSRASRKARATGVSTTYPIPP